MVFLTRTLEFQIKQIKVAINFILFVLFDLFAYNIKLLFSLLFALREGLAQEPQKMLNTVFVQCYLLFYVYFFYFFA